MRYALLVVVLLTGCAQKDGWWSKVFATQQDFQADRGQCVAQANSIPGAKTTQIATVFAGCMQGKGWQWVEAP